MRRTERLVTGTLTAIVLFAIVAPDELANAEPTWPRSIDVFTTDEFPIQRQGFVRHTPPAAITRLTVHRVDGLEALAHVLSQGLPADAERAQAVVLARMHFDVARVGRLAEAGADALSLAIRYRIDRYPAIVFDDGESVIYGVTDVVDAIAIYRKARRRR